MNEPPYSFAVHDSKRRRKPNCRFIQAGKMPPSMLYKLKYAILFNTGSIDGAWPGIEKAIALYPDYVDYLGLCWEKLGNNLEAINAYEKAYELSPTYTIAKEGLNRLNEMEI